MFYTYNQNNSGGSFVTDRGAGIAQLVIIEANNAADADESARSLGLYFNGVEDGRDCSCCGDRWSSQVGRDDGDEVPSLYGRALSEKSKFFVSWTSPAGYIHFTDGTRTSFDSLPVA